MRRDPWGQYAFKAFISYNHRDSEWAEWLENELEAFRVPVDLIGAWAPHGPVPASVSPVFRDRTSMAAGSHLDDGLRETLDSSAALIVICSPNSAKSEYVHEEVMHFKRSGKGDRIFPIIVDGEPFDKSKECFVEALKYEIDRDTGELTNKESAPIAADARKQGEGRDEAVVKLVAGVLGVEVGELREKHNRKLELEKAVAEKRARRAIIASMVAVVLTIIAGITGTGAYFQRQEALSRESELVARYVQGRASRGEEVISAALLLEVLPTAQGSIAPRPATPEALELAADLLAIRTLDRLIGDHQGPVLETAITPDGNFIATAGEDGVVGLWESETGQAIHQDRLNGSVNSVSFSPDGTRLVAASDSGQVRVWSVPDMEEVSFVDMETGVNAVRFNPTGTWLLIGEENGLATVWDIEDSEAINTVEHNRAISSVSFTPDGQRVAIVVPGSGVSLWWARSGRTIGRLAWTSNVRTARFSPDSTWILTASGQGPARIWNAYRATLLTQTPEDISENILSASFSSNGRKLVTTSDDNIVRLWDRRPGSSPQLVQSMAGHSALPWDAIFSPDGSMILSASRDGSVRVWDTETGAEHATLRAMGLSSSASASAGQNSVSYGAGHLAMDQSGLNLVTLNQENSVALWSMSALDDRSQVRHSLRGHSDVIRNAVFAPDGSKIATGGGDNQIILWEYETADQSRSFSGHVGSITSMSFDPSGQRLASASEDGSVRIWNVFEDEPSGARDDSDDAPELDEASNDTPETESDLNADDRTTEAEIDESAASVGEDSTLDMIIEDGVVILNDHNAPVLDVDFSEDGLWLASASRNGDVIIRNAIDFSTVHRINIGNIPVQSIDFDPDGTRILVADDTGRILFWSLDDGTLLNNYRVHTDTIRRAEFNADGSLIVSASQDGIAIISDAKTGEILQRLIHDQPVGWAEFIPGRSSVLTTGTDGRLRLWDARTGFEKPSPLRLQNPILQTVISPDANAVIAVQNSASANVWTLNEFSTEASLSEVRRTLQEIGVERAPELVLRELGLSTSTPPPFERYGLLSWKWWVPRNFWDTDDQTDSNDVMIEDEDIAENVDDEDEAEDSSL